LYYCYRFYFHSDIDEEFRLAHFNKQLAGIETIFLSASDAHIKTSSSGIRELAYFGRRLPGLVPPEIEDEVWKKAIERLKFVQMRE